jgi:hypothetical protein
VPRANLQQKPQAGLYGLGLVVERRKFPLFTLGFRSSPGNFATFTAIRHAEQNGWCPC